MIGKDPGAISRKTVGRLEAMELRTLNSDIANNAPGLSTRIEVLEGPLPRDLLQHICTLYGGNVDSRYSDLSFTRTVFNDNPAGHSYHAFAYSGETAIGCYSIIPLAISGSDLWAGKSEALYVTENYRPMGLFMMHRTHEFAASRGLEFIFGLTHERLGGTLQKMGFTALPRTACYRSRLLRPGGKTSARVLLNRAIQGSQDLLGTIVPKCLGSADRSFQVNCADLLGRALDKYGAIKMLGNSGRIIAADSRSLQWLIDLHRLEVISRHGHSDEFVLFSPSSRGGDAELIHCGNNGSGLANAINTLTYLIGRAEEQGGASLIVNQDSMANPELLRAATLLGFLPRTIKKTLYVKAARPDFLARCNGHISGFLNL